MSCFLFCGIVLVASSLECRRSLTLWCTRDVTVLVPENCNSSLIRSDQLRVRNGPRVNAKPAVWLRDPPCAIRQTSGVIYFVFQLSKIPRRSNSQADTPSCIRSPPDRLRHYGESRSDNLICLNLACLALRYGYFESCGQDTKFAEQTYCSDHQYQGI